jgi:TRAP transporter TAXI family solute receptor
MKRKEMILVLGALVLVVSLLFTTFTSCAPGGAKKMRLQAGTTSAASSVHLYGITVVKYMNAEIPEVELTVIETGGTPDNLTRMHNDELDIAFSTAYAPVWDAYTGDGATGLFDFGDDRYRQLPSYGAKQYLTTVRADSGVTKVEELEGKKFSAGIAGSFTEQCCRLTLEVLGITPDWQPGSTAEAVTQIKDRNWIGFCKTASGFTNLDASQIDIMSTTKIIPLGFTKEQMEKVKAVHPWMEWYTVPANAYKQLEEGHPSITAFGSGAGSTTKNHLSQETTYKMVRAMIDHQNELALIYPALAEVTHGKSEIEWFSALPGIAPMAAGFVQWCEEQGITVPETLIPPEYKR